MALTIVQAIELMGVATRLRGFVKGTEEKVGEYEGKKKTSHVLNLACGKAEIGLKYDPDEFTKIPPNGAFVEIICEQGSFNNKPFYNRPSNCRVLLNPDGTEPAKA